MPIESPLRESLLARSQVLTAFLNAAANTPGAKRVEVLHAHFVKLQELLDAMVGAKKHVLPGSPELPNIHWHVWTADQKIRPVLESTNRLLARYRFVHQLPPMLNSPTMARPAVAAATEPAHRSERKYGTAIPIAETKAVALLVELAGWRALGFLRRCDNCREWFVPRRGIDRFCKRACNKSAYRERHRDEYNAYMSRHRALKKKLLQKKFFTPRGNHDAKK
jgi:hypothetical protein